MKLKNRFSLFDPILQDQISSFINQRKSQAFGNDNQFEFYRNWIIQLMLKSQEKIQKSLRSIRQNPSIAQQLLFSNEYIPNSSTHTADPQINPQDTKNYINVIEDLFKKVKKTRKNIYECNQESDTDSQRKRNKKQRVKPKQLQFQMQQKINTKIAIQATQYQIQSQNQISQQQNKPKTKINKSLQSIFQKQMLALDEEIKSKNPIPMNINKSQVSLNVLPSKRISIDQNLHHSYQNVNQQSITKSKYFQNSQIFTNPQGYLTTSKKITHNPNNQQQLQLAFTESDQQFDNTQSKHQNPQNYYHDSDGNSPSLSFQNLIFQIDKDIQKLRDETNKNSHENSSKSLAFKTNNTSQIDNQEEYPNNKQQNNENDKYQNTSGIYSFRNGKGTQKGQSQFDLFDLPKERQKYNKIHNNESQNQKQKSKFLKKKAKKQTDSSNEKHEEFLNNNNTESNVQQLESLPYHKDYSLPISQHKVHKLMSQIQKRIKTSYLVIKEIPFEHSTREDNNQLQIDARFIKENKDRKDLIQKIQRFSNQDNNNKKYQEMCVRYQGAKSLAGDQVITPFQIDQAGKRILKDAKIWRSPGKNLLMSEKFKSLSSPLSNTNPCCFPPNPRFNLIHPTKSTVSTPKNRQSKLVFSQIVDSFSLQNEQLDQELSYKSISIQSASQIGCVMQQQGWDKIKNIRKKMSERYESLLSKY